MSPAAHSLNSYELLADYDAVVDHHNNSIEACVKELDLPDYALPQLFRRLRGVTFIGKDERETIKIGPMSNALAALVHRPVRQMDPWKEPGPQSRRHSIRLSLGDIDWKDNEKVIGLLEETANHLFLEIDRICNLLLALDKQSDPPGFAPLTRPARLNPGRWRLTPGKCDSTPMEFYRHASRIRNMPLIKFLLYYQVVEYYYPRFGGKTEIDQLTSTINACSITPDIVRSYLTGNKDVDTYHDLKNMRGEAMPIPSAEVLKKRAKYYEDRVGFFKMDAGSGLKEDPLNAAEPDDKLIKALVNRIYSLRCRIVHTKDPRLTNKKEPILPLSEEAKLLGRDIDLTRFIAQQVLSQANMDLFT